MADHDAARPSPTPSPSRSAIITVDDDPSVSRPAEGIDPAVAPSGVGCADCEQQEGWWVHLRRCAGCGNVGCCDSSPGQHATAHFRGTGHRYMQSFEPGEDWFFDFETRDVLEGPPLAAPTSHPSDQSAPGPAGRVPADWMDHIH